jgi:hypothetical protein
LFRRESPDVGDLVRAGAAQRFTPAAVVEEQHPATIVEDSFMSGRDGNATSVSILTDVDEGHETDHGAIRASSQLGGGCMRLSRERFPTLVGAGTAATGPGG